MADLTGIKMVWLELNGCSGNIISLLDGADPGFDYMISSMVDLVYEHSLMAAEGEEALEHLFRVLDQDFILAVEGAVPLKNGGRYQIVGNWQGKEITALEIIQMLGERARYVIAVGACASHGGVSAGRPNPSESVGIQAVLQRRVIQLPGCPCHPEWFLGTLAHLIYFGEPQLDEEGRPVFLYGISIHRRCERRSYFDQGIYATQFGEPTCMFMLGCRGPMTTIDCPIRRWNERINWPVQANTNCIGCAQFGFPDAMEPFVRFYTLESNLTEEMVEVLEDE
ncbi:MAG: hydrogenase (NiFe) small subunit HydA [Bacillota bacterium]|jgi:hydrogenase small subunit|nr:hydrogenase (NiFe) small subunit HydA [Bacillota bacterium]